jgi:hypothetical protein
MATASNHDPSGVAEHKPGLLDPPQALGAPTTRELWKNPDNRPLIPVSQAILVGVLVFVIGVLELPWWGAALTSLGMLVLFRRLLERVGPQDAKQV